MNIKLKPNDDEVVYKQMMSIDIGCNRNLLFQVEQFGLGLSCIGGGDVSIS